ncbi:insulinase-like:peptidase m16, c-terminal precursor [hydrocarbon metagenome]|uniref:Insulinase-like:peptidase m16, c-terminal n=1 Tax=hydrocarbon metagenome TaxID=938273 RepID=A0A0W8FVG6_9ZZZZ
MNRKLIFILMLVCSLLLLADSKKIEFVEYDLDNGLHVILHQDNSTPIVAVSIMYHVGSKNEHPERTGFAHFFEHLMFEGSENIPRGEYFKIVQGNGGTLNANTSFDRTFYYQILPSNQLELGLWLESERLLHAKIDSLGVETQRKVVKEERSQRYDNQPYGSILEEIFKRAYSEYPYSWTPIGSVQYIDMATIDEFIEFYETFYVPQNATLSIAGDIDIDKTKELVDLYFSDIPEGSKEIYRPNIVEPPMTAEIRDTVYDNIQLPAVIHSYRIPAQGTEDYYAINMLTTLLSGGQSSRMYKELVDNKQLALQAASIPLSLEAEGQFIVFGLTNVGIEPADLEGAIQEEINKAKNELVSDKEFEKLRNQIESRFVQQNSTVAGIAETLADYHVYFGDANLINTELERYMRVTKEDIKRVANEYLDENQRVVLYYLPNSQEK